MYSTISEVELEIQFRSCIPGQTLRAPPNKLELQHQLCHNISLVLVCWAGGRGSGKGKGCSGWQIIYSSCFLLYIIKNWIVIGYFHIKYWAMSCFCLSLCLCVLLLPHFWCCLLLFIQHTLMVRKPIWSNGRLFSACTGTFDNWSDTWYLNQSINQNMKWGQKVGKNHTHMV